MPELLSLQPIEIADYLVLGSSRTPKAKYGQMAAHILSQRRRVHPRNIFVVIALLAILGRVTSATTNYTSSKTSTEGDVGVPGRSKVVLGWVDVILELIKRDKAGFGIAPTILSRISFITSSSMYDAWAAYDDTAAQTQLNAKVHGHDTADILYKQETAISYAAYRALLDLYPVEKDFLRDQMTKLKLNPDNDCRDMSAPEGVGNLAAAAVIKSRRSDKSNQNGDIPGSNGEPYSDYTGYEPVNTVDRINDPDHWQPIRFYMPNGSSVVKNFLTPHWGEITPFGLTSGSQFLPGPPPRYGSAELKRDIEEVVRENGNLTLEKKAIVEFMRGGPGSTSPFGVWLQFIRFLSDRDCYDLAKDVKLFFGLSAVGFDAFIGAWNTKKHYDSPRPYTLVRVYYAGQKLRGWGGPGNGTVTVAAEDWLPYAPLEFITPPFPGYVSGHSTASSALATFLVLFTGSDNFGYKETWKVGSRTEPGYPCNQIQREEGKPVPRPDLSCDFEVQLPTFTETARLARESRILGGYHIRSDDEAGLRQGTQIGEQTWKVLLSHFDGQVEAGERR